MNSNIKKLHTWGSFLFGIAAIATIVAMAAWRDARRTDPVSNEVLAASIAQDPCVKMRIQNHARTQANEPITQVMLEDFANRCAKGAEASRQIDFILRENGS